MSEPMLGLRAASYQVWPPSKLEKVLICALFVAEPPITKAGGLAQKVSISAKFAGVLTSTQLDP